MEEVYFDENKARCGSGCDQTAFFNHLSLTCQRTKPLAAVNGIKPSVFILQRYNPKSDMGSSCEVK